CTSGDSCAGGTCRGSPISCDDGNPCTTDACDPATGCVFANNGSACDDGNACTRTDFCAHGGCVGGNSVVCAAVDQCHDAGVCDPASGACSNPERPDGTRCDDGSLCTSNETCQLGTCTAVRSGLDHPTPKSAG